VKIDWAKIGIRDLSGLICEILRKKGIDATLVGGACISIYSDNRYISGDLDFITYSSTKEIEEIFTPLGFLRKSRRHFEHPECRFFIEFPAPPIAIGNELIKDYQSIKTKFGIIRMLTPTDCVRDRLAAYFFWGDMQSLEQALMVANRQNINIEVIKKWALKEGASKELNKFLSKLKKTKTSSQLQTT